MDIDLSKLNEIDFKNVGALPIPAKAGLIAALCVVVLALGYFLHIQGMLSELSAAAAKEITLKQDFEDKQNKAANLEAYKAQMKDMEESFGTMLRQLPSKTEVADLLVDVTQTGLANGLTFQLFKPEKETPLEFYAELPITLEVAGTYHDFGSFVSGVASLPRIVTLHDLSIQSGTNRSLVMKATAKTYRYLDAQEIATAAAERAKAKKGK
jgi:type IV pilus assembly protein PilO